MRFRSTNAKPAHRMLAMFIAFAGLALFLTVMGKRMKGAEEGGAAAPSAPTPGEVDERLAGESDRAWALRGIDHRIGQLMRGGQASSEAWGAVATAYLERARVTTNPDDFLEAAAALERAFIRGDAGEEGPFLVRARFNLAVHRFEQAEQDLTLATGGSPGGVHDPEVAAADVLAADVLAAELRLAVGDYAAACQRFASLLTQVPAPAVALGRARCLAMTGALDESIAIFDRGRELAWDAPALDRAELELWRARVERSRGRWEEAREAAERADRVFSGWAPVRAELADIRGHAGDTQGRSQVYEDLVRSHRDPVHMEVLAAQHLASGDGAEHVRWRDAALRGFEQRLADFPELAYAGAAGHLLTYDDADKRARALGVAEQLVQHEPSGPARMLLARAFAENGRPEDGRRVLEELLATPFRSAELHMQAALSFADVDEARSARERALAVGINPALGAD